MLDEIKRQTEDLLTYYPGRGRISLLWLVIIPILSFLAITMRFGMFLSVWPHWHFHIPNHGIPQYMYYIAAHSFDWIYTLSLVIMLIRICHSERKLWRDTVQIMASSLLYALVLGLPCVLFAFIWIFFHVGTSVIALFQILVGLICAIGSLILLLVCLGSLGHRFGIVIPFLIFLTTVLPIGDYPPNIVPLGWRYFQTFVVPLSSTITIIFSGMLNGGLASSIFWIAAFLHAAIGYTLAFVIWKKSTEPEDQ
jgi:hypothetical protein